MTPMDIKLRYSHRPHTAGVMAFFSDTHLHPQLQAIVTPLRLTAFAMADATKDGPDLTLALRSMLDAKDHFIRHHLTVNNFHLIDPAKTSMIKTVKPDGAV